MTLSTKELAGRYLERNPDATAPQLAGALEIPVAEAREIIDDSQTNDVDGRDTEATGKDESVTPTEHYERLTDLYGILGEVDGCYCPGNRDFYGWYHTRQGPGSWDGQGRAWALGREFPGIQQELERVVYATVNYVPAEWYMDAWQSFNHGDGGKEWERDDTPMPGYGDLRAYAPFADIDLSDEVKQQRPDGDIPKKTVEKALSVYLEAFEDLAGGREHVYALDSVGGAYVFVAPTATAPIADLLEYEARATLFEDMRDRLNDWLGEIKDDVNDRLPAAAGTFEADLVNNKNRLYKAPLSIHKSLEGVVTPLDPEDPSYDYTPLADVDEDLIAETEAWADSFTDDHTDAVAAIVATLWPEYYDRAGDWRSAVRARTSDLTEEQEANRKSERRTLPETDLPEDVERTDEIEVIKSKIEAIDVQLLARDLADEWDTDPGRDPPRFAASWHQSHSSGTSCFADRDKFVDLKEGNSGGGALKLIARDRGIITHCSQSLRGEDYWKAVNELRKEGYEIPYFTGQDGTHPDGLQLYDEPEDTDDARRQALRVMRASKRR